MCTSLTKNKGKNSPKNKVLSAELKLDIFAEPRTISALRAAMSPEIDNKKRCKLSLHTDKTGRTLSMMLRSEDMVSLRAGLNTNLRLAASALKSINAAKQAASTKDSEKD